MDNEQKCTKLERTTEEQLQQYIIFCKQHPELQRGKLTPTNSQVLQTLWSELAETLNSLRGPTRTAAKWRVSLMHWKHQLQSRARKIKAHAHVTGGGPPAQAITPFEEQAIATFGTAAVDGLPGVVALGHQSLPPIQVNIGPVSPETESSLSPSAPALTSTSPTPTFPAASSPSPPISPLIIFPPPVSPSSLSPPILPSPIPSPSNYIPPEGKVSAAKMFGEVLKK